MMRTISDRISSRFRQQSITPEGHRRRKSQPQHNRQDMLYVSGVPNTVYRTNAPYLLLKQRSCDKERFVFCSDCQLSFSIEAITW